MPNDGRQIPPPTVNVPSARARFLDGLIIEGADWDGTWTDLKGKKAWVVEAKSGEVDMGVLGQALFGAQLVRRVCPEARVIPIAAAPKPPNDLLRAVLEEFHPDGIRWRAYGDVRSVGGRTQRSSGESTPHHLREAMLAWYAKRFGGLLVARAAYGRSAFCGVRAKGSEHSLAGLKPAGVLLLDRDVQMVDARRAEVTLQEDERVHLIDTCTDLYRTQMGKALFSAEIARRQMGLPNAIGIACINGITRFFGSS